MIFSLLLFWEIRDSWISVYITVWSNGIFRFPAEPSLSLHHCIQTYSVFIGYSHEIANEKYFLEGSDNNVQFNIDRD
jgi:hypothetical protein